MSTGEHEHDHGSPVTTADTAQNAVDDAVKRKLDLDVQIADVGPCKKHLKVVVARPEIDRQFNESIGTMAREAAVPGSVPDGPRSSLFRSGFGSRSPNRSKALF